MSVGAAGIYEAFPYKFFKNVVAFDDGVELCATYLQISALFSFRIV